MRIKPGASIIGIQPETVVAMLVVEPICYKYGVEFWLTEATGGKHGFNSVHPLGFAIDTRDREMPEEQQKLFIAELRVALGGRAEDNSQGEFDVINEDDHIHVQVRPQT